jgi:serine/threonine protein kinase
MNEAVFGNRYTSTGIIRSGGGGDVFICDDPNLSRRVAIKFLQSDVEIRRLHDEIRALQSIRSKNVVQVLDIVNKFGLGTGIVTEFIPGNDLSHPSERPTTRDAILKIIYQLSNGLRDIHAAGIIHRDVKPENIKYDDERLLKIFDFNLSRPNESAHTHGFRGSRGFSAPELYGSGPISFTSAVDVYSLAVTIVYLALGGTLPSCFKTYPPQPHLWSPGFSAIEIIDRPLVYMLTRAIALDPAERPSSEDIWSVSKKLLLQSSHRATMAIYGDSRTYILNNTNKAATLRHPLRGGASITLAYDGLDFLVSAMEGSVLANRLQCQQGQLIPDSCVIDLGTPTGRLQDRRFVTFDLSHPEVIQ